MMNNKYPMTKAEKQKLEQELIDLKENKRKDLDQEIKKARSFCDFSEDVSYQDMIHERMALDKKINSIENMLHHAEIIIPKKDPSSGITLGNTVTFYELPDGDEETYTIVGMLDDSLDSTISIESPIAKSLLGHHVNDDVKIQTPGGSIKIKITNVNGQL